MISRIATVFVFVGCVACSLQRSVPRCGFADFEATPYDHLIEHLPPIVTAELVVRVKVRSGDFNGDVRPGDVGARIELHGPDGFRQFIEPTIDGSFVRKNLSPGTYCFKLSADGFRSMIGVLIVDRALRNSAPVEIELMIAE